nr:chloroperoxidase [Quercus suber]
MWPRLTKVKWDGSLARSSDTEVLQDYDELHWLQPPLSTNDDLLKGPLSRQAANKQGKAVAILAVIKSTIAHPSYASGLEKRLDGFSNNLTERLGTYKPPGPNDSRGPCPALNTLANHGLINRNGKNLNSNDIIAAFPRGFGINTDGFATALHNFEVVCEYIKGSNCSTSTHNGTFILTNLTILGEPHAFEHDHSFSRQDYHQNYYKPSNPPTKKLANYQDFNQIRLQRTSQQYQADFPGSFQQNIPVQVFEVGFIFGATFDRDSKGNMVGATPSVRLDWWNFWFSEESFPTQLGWVPASTEVFNLSFITSVSKAVLSAPITSTPSSLPPGATAKTASAAGSLPDQDPSPTVPLFGGTAYIAPTAPSAIKTSGAAKREAAAAPLITLVSSVLSDVASEVTAAPSLVNSALQLVGPAPSKFDPYQQKLDVTSLQAQIVQAQSYEAAVVSKITSLQGSS